MFENTDWRLRTRRDVAAALGGTWGIMGIQGAVRSWPGAIAIGLAATAGIAANYAQHREVAG